MNADRRCRVDPYIYRDIRKARDPRLRTVNFATPPSHDGKWYSPFERHPHFLTSSADH